MGYKASGAQFLVNTTTANDQWNSHVVALSNGGFAVAWMHQTSTGVVSGEIRARIYDSRGEAIGSDFALTASPDYYERFSLTALTDGRFAATWSDASGSSYDVKSQFHNADGAADGGVFTNNATTAFYQQDPDSAALSGGGLVSAWTDTTGFHEDTYYSVVRMAAVDENGNSTIAETQVSETGVDAGDAKVAVLTGGNIAVTWMAYSSSTEYDIKGRVFSSNGSPIAEEFSVNSTKTGWQIDADIAALSGGGFVAVWQDNSRTGVDTALGAIKAQRFAANGQKAGGEFLVNTTTAGLQQEAAVTSLDDGGFVVVWTDGSKMTSGDSADDDIRAQRFSANGAKLGDEFSVASVLTKGQTEASVSVLDDGRLVVSWTDESATGLDTAGSAIKSRIFEWQNDNTAPTSIKLSKATVSENVSIGTVVGDFSAVDADGDALKWALNDNAGGLFKVSGYHLVTAKAINYEALQFDSITARVTDTAGHSVSKTFQIKILDKPEIIGGDKGDNMLTATIGADIFQGKAGRDTASYAKATAGVLANLAASDDNTGFARGDTYSSIENLTGSAKADQLFGDGSVNILRGGGGNDRLQGGLGGDGLYGGAGQDLFVFHRTNESAARSGQTDTIFDFNLADDRIDLRNFDAASNSGRQHFDFIGKQAFSHTAGELRFEKKTNDTYLYGDTNGDGKADFAVHFDAALNLTKGDLLV